MENRGTLNLPRQNPWLVRIGVAIFAALLLSVMAWEIGSALTAETKTEVPVVVRVAPIVPPVAQPAQQIAPAIIVPLPVVHQITVDWQEDDEDTLYYMWGKDGNGTIYRSDKAAAEGIRLAFVGTGVTEDSIVYIKEIAMITSDSSDNPFRFSPNSSEWYEVKNLPNRAGDIKGAVRDGEDIIILANWQYQPWQYKGYRARVTAEDLKKASLTE